MANPETPAIPSPSNDNSLSWPVLQSSVHEAQTEPLWSLNMQCNLAFSPLYQLPNELLLMICRNLDGADVYIARQTCSLLWRVLSGPEFVSLTHPRFGDDWVSTHIKSARLARQNGITHYPYYTDYELEEVIETGDWMTAPEVLRPTLGVNWDEVCERLRRRSCCSACIRSRLPRQGGGPSAYETTMLRMANEMRYCIVCGYSHPLIMFSQSERENEYGSMCIMAEGSVSICPHHSVDWATLREWREIIEDRDDEDKTPPWLLRCDQCFQELEEPLRASAVPPQATYLPKPQWEWGFGRRWSTSDGALCVQWCMPLQVEKATVMDQNWFLDMKEFPGESERGKAAELRKAFAGADETYNDLLCPHASFDDPRTYQNLRHIVTRSAGLYRDYSGGFELTKEGFRPSRSLPRLQGSIGDDLCRLCGHHWQMRLKERFQGFEYFWAVNDRGLFLRRQMKLSVPDLTDPFSEEHRVWLQMLNPASYNLDTDTELRHITWCPDKECANGRNWAGHLGALKIISEHHKCRVSGDEYCWRPLFIHYYGVYREGDPHVSVHRMDKSHVVNGVKFLPVDTRGSVDPETAGESEYEGSEDEESSSSLMVA